MSERREQYTHAPLVIVTAEIRIGYEPGVKEDATRDAFAAALRDTFPVLSLEQNLTFSVDGADVPLQPVLLPQIRSNTLDGSASVTLNPNAVSLTMDGTAYSRYSDSFGPMLEKVLDALSATLPYVIVQRAGLRYIDELRPVEPPLHVHEWARWVSPELLGAASALPGTPAVGTNATVEFSPSSDRSVRFSYGSFNGITVVEPALPFGRKSGPATRMFILDVDSSWSPEGYALLQPEELASVAYDLHKPAGEVFERAITEEAREMFRKPVTQL